MDSYFLLSSFYFQSCIKMLIIHDSATSPWMKEASRAGRVRECVCAGPANYAQCSSSCLTISASCIIFINTFVILASWWESLRTNSK